MDPFIGEIRMMAFMLVPTGWASCDGQTMGVGQNSALSTLLGKTFGGDGTTTFALPDLRGRTPVGFDANPNPRTNYPLGAQGGAEAVVLTAAQMPAHNHAAVCNRASGTLKSAQNAFPAADSMNYTPYATTAGPSPMAGTAIDHTGGGAGHDNMQPFLCTPFCIALTGAIPSKT